MGLKTEPCRMPHSTFIGSELRLYTKTLCLLVNLCPCPETEKVMFASTGDGNEVPLWSCWAYSLK